MNVAPGLFLAICLKAVTSSGEAVSVSNYCGLYCVKAVAALNGIRIEMDQLIRPEHFERGMTTSGQLVDCLRLTGIDSTARTGLTMSRLLQSERPMILHVRTGGYRAKFRHWVTYLGKTKSGAIRIFDPPMSTIELHPSELQAIWDGSGVVLSPTSAGNSWSIPFPEFGITVLFILACQWFLRKRHPVFSIAISGLIGIAVYSSICPWAIRHDRQQAVRRVQSFYYPLIVPEVGLERIRQVHSDDSAVIVDARPFSSFVRGHIPGAINLPINTSWGVRRQFVEAIDRSKAVIVYCQSDRCPWADTIASDFKIAGHRDVTIYRGGMNDWNEASEHD